MTQTPRRGPRRVAMISVHTSPLDQPGTGDAGGLNVYVVESARRLAARGVEVEIFTRATSASLPESVPMAPGVTVQHIVAGPFEGLTKEDLPGQLCAFAAGIMRATAARPEGWFDVIHSHYWLSGQIGWLMMDRWDVPLVHTMHTMARVKNRQLAEGDRPEPAGREIGEAQVVQAASRLVANTETEAAELVELYDADPGKVRVVTPGVDLGLFAPVPAAVRGEELDPAAVRDADRAALGLDPQTQVILFVGRIQPLKAPDVLVRAVAEMVGDSGRSSGGLRRDRLRLVICGGQSGSGLDRPTALPDLAAELGVSDLVTFLAPVPREELARWYRAADVVGVPSHNESFGLVAAEAQAAGTPVVAAAVGGLLRVVGDAGVLVDGHDPRDWATALTNLLADRERLAGPMRRAAAEQGARFSWEGTADRLLEAYAEACYHCGSERSRGPRP